MSLKRIRLELARDHDYPQGSHQCGYEFTAPLDGEGHMDPGSWKQHRADCAVTRFWEGSKPELGHLVRKPGGKWAFHYDIFGDEDDDETGYRFSSERFVVGEYVSILEHDDKMRTFKVVSVANA
ncbi:MAG: hypothetical protein KDJ67_08385 [Nitratireductor sp.]|nr:hypothetical protein [Nitratireductor sp.]